MAQNKKKSKRDRKTPDADVTGTLPPGTPDPDHDGVEQTDRFTARKWLVITISVAAVWWVGLSLLTLLSANPTTVNRKQIVDSDVVVVARVKDLTSGSVTVTKQWIDPNPQTSLIVTGLSEFEVQTGDTVVLPLTGGPDGTFYLTRVHPTKAKPNGTTYIYPATDVVLNQVDEFASVRRESLRLGD